jgi:aldose 1-epimerase
MNPANDPVITLVEGPARVDLYPGAGGRIGQITIGEREVLRGPEDRSLGWVWWGWYVMAPWANRIPGGVAHFGGDVITVPVNWPDGTAIHGLVGTEPWEIVSAGSRAATFAIDVALDRYHVRTIENFSLAADALDVEVEVTNLATWPVPAGIGIHPWFVAAPVRVPADLIWPGDGPLPDGTPRPVRPEEDLRRKVTAPPMDRCFTGLTESSADIGDLTLAWNGPITQVVVYSGDAGYVCVEPVTMANDGIRMADEGIDGTGVIALDPGATLTVSYRLSWPP